MPTQQSAAVATGDTILAQDHNEVVTDIAAIIAEKGAASGIASLNSSAKVIQPPADGVVSTAALAANAATNYGEVEILNTTFATASTSYVDITSLSFSMIVTGGPLMVIFDTTGIAYGTAGGNLTLAARINSVDHQIFSRHIGSTGTIPLYTTKFITGIPAGTYTIQGRQKSTNGNNCSIGSNPGHIRMTVIEFKR